MQELTRRTAASREVDLLDVDILREVFVTQKIEAVIHLAGLKA